MEYHGKLYGRMGSKYFDTGHTSENFDSLSERVKYMQEENKKLMNICLHALEMCENVVMPTESDLCTMGARLRVAIEL
tara:strand:- start:331 stop:564 length:234 start_codon:yes stop_codon:yes gene_type:complete